MRAAREVWFAGQLDLDPARLIFIDETGLNTKLARLRGRCRRGERLSQASPTVTGARRHSSPGYAWVASAPQCCSTAR